jgi:hypothetical protein
MGSKNGDNNLFEIRNNNFGSVKDHFDIFALSFIANEEKHLNFDIFFVGS